MYRSTVELRHSSTPNTTAVLLTHGVVGIYASSDIQKGETLTMSYGKADGNKQHLRTPAASYNGVRCKNCRFNLSPSRDACHCGATPFEGPISILVQQLSDIEDEHVVHLTGKVDVDNPCMPLQHLEKLWNSIFASDFNPKTYSNRKKQLQALNTHADFRAGNAHSLCRKILYLVHAITSHIREVYKPNSLARLQELMFVMKNILSLFIRRKCPDGMLGIVLNIFKQIEDVCREAETIANIWMEYQQLAELVTMRGLLDRSKLDFHNRFAANF
ncbi:uncharacterized protein LOC118463195 isoform X2 [Anopheles albimanus]|uniref:uncharacterized protein LOC118463195 isoform X2 n=1 Tax=Anopheles albimanus TaxID=7167 RepID=UPI00164073D0|nr:uncharacterized protein LOC118463195 isoform X2 [Anopheles albimanus]